MIYLILGDLYVPYKKPSLPNAIKKVIPQGKIQKILCTGNICTKKELRNLHAICNDIEAVRGEMDDFEMDLEREKVLNISNFKVGLVSSIGLPSNDPGRIALKQMELGVDILIHGGTHRPSADIRNDCLYLDPGSATGAPLLENPSSAPSFIILWISQGKATAYLYELGDDNELRKTQKDFIKGS